MKLKYTWLPASTPDNNSNTIQITHAHGSTLTTENQQVIYDAISSWWCKPLGHTHPLVINSIHEQLKYFEHHIPAQAWNETIETLSTILVKIFSQMDKVVYACDGSSAIEIAMKLSIESRVLQEQTTRNKFVALDGAYHGETVFTLGVCGIDSYKANFIELLHKNHFIQHIVYVNNRQDPLWHDSKFDHNFWDNYFSSIAMETTALIFEPIVQGAAGIKIISKDFLVKLVKTARKYGIHIIADEIMVGLGRLGVLSVSKEILGIEPDIICFAKNLTAGSIPMSAVIVNQSITDIYRRKNKAFYHSHTHSCNAIAAKVACNYIKYLNSSNILKQIEKYEPLLIKIFNNFVLDYPFVTSCRVIGAIAALEIQHDVIKHINIFDIGIKNHIYLRNINNIIYIMPPLYNLSNEIPIIERLMRQVLSELQNIFHRQ